MNERGYPAPVLEAEQGARSALGLSGELLAGWAPGRVNLIGEHTDYNAGWVLPIATERVVALVGQRRTDDAVRLYSRHHREIASFSLAQLPDARDKRGAPLWARYIAGVLGQAGEQGLVLGGFSAAIAGDVPLGGGMSSSAALIIATLTWLKQAFGWSVEPLELARIGQRAETRGSGVRVGILDQAASVLGQPGIATLIDCRDLSVRAIPFRLPDVGLLICETGVERSLATTGYNQRVAECEAATAAFAAALRAEGDPRPVQALRDITQLDYLRLAGQLPEPARQRARHIISENARTLAAADALLASDAVTFGRLVLESHASLRDDYAVSCPELDVVVEIAMRVPGALGARLVGAGFGGGALIVARQEALDPIAARLQLDYSARTGRTPTIHRVVPAGGPGSATLT